MHVMKGILLFSFLLNRNLVLAYINRNRVTFLYVTFHHLEREWVEDEFLDGAFERAGAVAGVVAAVGDEFLCLVRKGDGDLLVEQTFDHVLELEVDDVGELVFA